MTWKITEIAGCVMGDETNDSEGTNLCFMEANIAYKSVNTIAILSHLHRASFQQLLVAKR